MFTLLHVVLAALAALVAVATLLPLSRSTTWWVRSFDFPRAQIAAVACLALPAQVALAAAAPEVSGTSWGVMGVTAACAAYQLARMFPYSPLAATQTVAADPGVARERRLRLVITNVWMENRDAARWAAVIRAADPDVVVAVETDAWWVERVREALGEGYAARVEVPQDNTYGIVVASRLPMEDVQVRYLVEPTVPSVFAKLCLPSGDRVQAIFLHPRPPRPDIGQDSDLRDAELVLAARAAEALPRPLVVAGDLNDVAWSHTTKLFQKLARLLDPRVGRGLFATFHTRRWYLRFPLDHVFHSEDLALVELRRLDHVGSDHFPILIDLAYQPHRRAEQETPKPDHEDRAEAVDKVREVRAEVAGESPVERATRDREDR